MTLPSLSSQPIDESSILREQVLSTDNHDGRHFNTNFILSDAEKILRLGMGTTEEVTVEKLNQVVELNNIYEQLSYHIRQVSIEIVSDLNAKTANQQHSTTIGVLRKLCWYSWEDKMVLMLAGFSIIYGEYILLDSRLCKGGSKLGGLAKKLESLTQNNLAETLPSYTQKVIVDCLSYVLELTKCVVELKPCPYYSPPPSVILALPMATYWIATTLINVSAACVCGAHFKVHQNELVELTALIFKTRATFSPELAKKKAEESFQILRHAWYHNSFSNRVELFRLIFNVKNDYEGIFERHNFLLGLNYWRNDQSVLLLITSGFDISNEQIDFLNWFFDNSSPYIIWIPIMSYNAAWTTEDEHHFEKVKERMYNLRLLNDPQKRLLPQFIRFVKKELFPKCKMRWGEDAILVSIDLKGRIVHLNVVHMILTWAPHYIQKNTIGVQRLYNIIPWVTKEVKEGTSGVNRVVPEIDEMINDFLSEIGGKINAWADLVDRRIRKVLAQSTPYHNDREKDLWQQETTWSLHLLAPKFESYQPIGELIIDWIQEEKYIFLYGGNDMKWVQEFTSKVREVGSKTQLNIELVYVGRNKKIRGIIDKKRMSHSPLHNSASVWWFWTRLRSMFLSRIHYLDVTNCPVKDYNNDEILQGLKKLLAYESTNTTIEGWALLSKGAKVIVCGHGTKMLRVMNEYQIWKENIAPKGFGQAFKDHHEMIFMNRHSCCTLEYPIKLDKIPENETCHECSRSMHKFLTFTCCHGHDVDSDKD
ncbi:PREDICTED: protein SIEVE ELEMENT OCCLUSION B-like isoform X2 [Ipomoea nil]|uniref:protein SIEVE ELEMENT OCCLUSION B-like isoform X2 n=1 Tax=Ipomoea nil TaxID=35883 RepID=UPI000900A0E8|nr:PREDICTED: protein SIEVE ELEMENT OCCLUSION B-like isoform X2 [Ipomoea nil]